MIVIVWVFVTEPSDAVIVTVVGEAGRVIARMNVLFRPVTVIVVDCVPDDWNFTRALSLDSDTTALP